jgi:tetratricopeptide (TPR) repeat protein
MMSLSQVINFQGFDLWQADKLPQAREIFRQGLAVIEPVESKFASGNETYKVSLAQLSGNLARCLLSGTEGKPEVAKEALALAKKAVKLAPHFKLFRNTLALAQYRTGDFKEAKNTLDASMARAKGGDCWDWFLLAMVQWQVGEKEQARQWFDRAAKQMEEPRFSSSQVGRALRAEAAKVLGIKVTESK